MNIKKLKDTLELTLHKPNKQILGELTMLIDNVSISKKIDDIDSISFDMRMDTIDRFSHIKSINNLYEEVKEERLVLLNNEEYYVIKSINENSNRGNTKTIECVSLEHKLTRINITLEDVGMVILESDEDEDYISLEGLIESETGWKLNHVDEQVRYEMIQNEQKIKARWQESVNMSWYSFLTEEVANTFLCIMKFDTVNKKVDIYDINTFGENIELYLSKDNYIRSLAKSTSTNEIVTRLRLTGKDEIDIRGINPMGTDYLEDYSYFIENEDMSKELENSLNRHNDLVEDNQTLWSELMIDKATQDKKLTSQKASLYMVCETLKQLIILRDNYLSVGDIPNAEYTQIEIDKKTIEKTTLEQSIRDVEVRLKEINTIVLELNKQMDRRLAVDENGDKIFSEDSLSELNEFLYYDTYVNNSFLSPESLLEGGLLELKKRCKPSVEYDIDVQDFISRVINQRSESFDGDLNLGDIVIFYDDILNKESYLYFVGYEYSPHQKSLTLNISNKKSKVDNTVSIANKLRDIVNMNNYINSKQYMFNQIKYNKI